MGEALSTLSTFAWCWQNSHLYPSRACFCFPCFWGKPGHQYMVALFGDMRKMMLKEAVLLVPCRSRATWIMPSQQWCCLAMLTQCLAILCYLGLKIKAKSNKKTTPVNLHQCVAWGMLAHKQDDHILHRARPTLSTVLSSVKTGCSKGYKPGSEISAKLRVRDVSLHNSEKLCIWGQRRILTPWLMGAGMLKRPPVNSWPAWQWCSQTFKLNAAYPILTETT